MKMRRKSDITRGATGRKALAKTAIAVLTLSCALSAGAVRAEQGAVITPEAIRAHHQALVDIASRAGGLDAGIRLNDAGTEAADYILNGYKEAGLENVRFEEFHPNRWWPESYSLTLLEGPGGPEEELTAFPLWNCTGADDLELGVVYAGFGTKGEFRGLDVRGKAVLIDMKRILHFIASYRYTKALDIAKDKGAAAVIIAETRIPSPTGNSVGSSGKIKDQKAGMAEPYPLPVFSIGKDDGAKLKERMGNGTAKVRVNLECTLEPWRAVNIVGELPGAGSVDEYIIIGGHYDSWFDGAIDNLGSQASLLEMAKYFSRIPRAERNRNLLFVSIFGHELGNDQMGHAAFVERHADIRDKITCFVDIDGSGSWGWEEKGESGEIDPTNMDDKGGLFATSNALLAIARKAVFSHADGPWGQYPLNSFVADLGGPISEAGFPNLLLISKHIYYHSPLDTIDRISPDQVYRRTLMNIEAIEALMDSPEGYLIGVDTNPDRVFKKGEKAKPDISPADLPRNPNPWTGEAPKELDIHVIPPNPRVFSPVIAWVGYWQSDGIGLSDNVRWDFGGILGLFKKHKNPAAGTMYFLPGTKTIEMTVTDAQGRSTTISRKIKVSF